MLFLLLRKYDDTRLQDFHNYFEATWLNGIFAITLWNQYNVDNVHRTNSAVESWHACFNRCVRSAHPNIFVLITHLQRENCNTVTRVDQAKLSFKTTATQSKYDRLHQRIQQLYDSHRDGRISSDELFKKARHIIHVFE